MPKKLKILQLCKKFPFPLRDGESIAVFNLSKVLVESGCEISLLAMNTTKHHVDIETAKANCCHYNSITTVDVDNQIKLADAFLNLFTSQSYHISRYISADYKSKLENLLQETEFDIIQLETLYLTPYVQTIRKYSNAKIVLRSHNIEHEIWQRIISNTRPGLKKLYLKYLTKQLKAFELAHLNEYDCIITVSERDKNKMVDSGYKGSCISIPIGLDLDKYPMSETRNEAITRICFIGAMDWIPNREGLSWFLKDIWPQLIQKFPELELHIAGRNTEKALKELEIDKCFHHGEVDSAGAFISSHHAMIVPLLSGSGIRVKILESLVIGTPVISTSIGHEGIGTADKIHLMEADSKEEFCKAFEQLINNRNLVMKLVEEGRSFVTEKYSIKKIGNKLFTQFEELTGRSRKEIS